MRAFRSLADLEIHYPHPLAFARGETVTILKSDPVWPGWVWVATADGNTGWAPQSYLDPVREDEGRATALQAFTASELSIKKGEILESEYEVDGWLWCRNNEGKTGWAPAFNLRPVQQSNS